MENCVLVAQYKVIKCTFCNWLYNQVQLLFHILSLFPIYSKMYLHFAKRIGNGVEMVSVSENRKRTMG